MMVRRCWHIICMGRTKRFFFKSAISSGIFAAAIATTHEVQQTDRRYLEQLSAQANAIFRFIRTAKIGLVISLDYWYTCKWLNEKESNYTQKLSNLHTRNAERILNGCLVNGGTYVKIGQGLVSLSHLLPKEYIHVLTALQDKCLTQGIDELETIFQEDFGTSPELIFKEFNTQPIAAASLAQVFVATTQCNQKVAVKVQYKDLQRRFHSDVAMINFLLKVGAYLNPTFDFSWILDDLVGNLKSELDFHKEGENAERCAKDLAHLTFIYVPKVHWELSSTRVLVTEFVDGFKINDNEGLIKAGYNLSDIDRKMFEAFGQQIFQIGFVHADPHPGNIFVRKVGKVTQLVILDHGLYQGLSEDERVSLSRFWQAMVLKDVLQMEKYSKELGVEDYAKLAEILTQTPLRTEFKLVTRLTQKELDYFQKIASERMDVITKTLKDMPRNLLFVVRNLNTIRSIAHDHGDTVNRYTILARIATKNAVKATDSYFQRIRALKIYVNFEYQLWKRKSWKKCMILYFKLLKLFGRSPNDTSILESVL